MVRSMSSSVWTADGVLLTALARALVLSGDLLDGGGSALEFLTNHAREAGMRSGANTLGFRDGHDQRPVLETISKRAVKFAVVPGGDISLVVTPILIFPHRGEGTFEIVS